MIPRCTNCDVEIVAVRDGKFVHLPTAFDRNEECPTATPPEEES